jgi:YegS/Rv2252/BmrU family lipid kinase
LTDPRAPWLAIVNPVAGGSRRHSWPAVERELRAAGVALNVERTMEPHHGERIAREAVLNGLRRVLVVGGDGSVHDVVNGVMSAGPLHKEVTLAVAPLGTGNDWARSLGMDLPARQMAAAIAAGHTIQHDVGVIDFSETVPPKRRWFINVAGAGFDAFVISRLPHHVPSRLAYLWGALTGLLSYRAPRFTIRVDDQVIERRLLVAFVANAQACGNGMRVAPVARVDDGLLDVVTIDEVGVLLALFKIAKLYRGTILGDAVVRHVRSANVRIDALPAADVEAEGQTVGRTPAVLAAMRGALRVIVPTRSHTPQRPDYRYPSAGKALADTLHRLFRHPRRSALRLSPFPTCMDTLRPG